MDESSQKLTAYEREKHKTWQINIYKSSFTSQKKQKVKNYYFFNLFYSQCASYDIFNIRLRNFFFWNTWLIFNIVLYGFLWEWYWGSLH